MRPLLIAFALLLPQFGWGQLSGGNGFEAGSYVLNASNTVRQQGQLKLRSNTQLLVQNTDGKPLKLTPNQVSSFRIGRSKYVTAGNFQLNDYGLKVHRFDWRLKVGCSG